MTDRETTSPHREPVQGEGQHIRTANPSVVPYGSESLDEVFNEDQSLMDPESLWSSPGADEDPTPRDSAEGDDGEEQPEAQPTGSEDEPEQQGEETIELPEGVTLKDLEEHHPELAKVYKSMQADYTRKTQRLADERREVGDLEKKAQWWDQMASNDALLNHIREFVERQESGSPHTTPQAATRQHQSDNRTDYDYGDDLDDFTPEQQARVRSIVEDAISQEVKPYVQDLYAREANRQIKSLENEIPGFKEAFPEIKRYREQNGNRQTWEEAAKIVLFGKQREAGMREAMEAVSRKKRVSSVNGYPAPSVPRAQQPAALPATPSLDQALEYALSQHQNVSGFRE